MMKRCGLPIQNGGDFSPHQTGFDDLLSRMTQEISLLRKTVRLRVRKVTTL